MQSIYIYIQLFFVVQCSEVTNLPNYFQCQRVFYLHLHLIKVIFCFSLSPTSVQCQIILSLLLPQKRRLPKRESCCPVAKVKLKKKGRQASYQVYRVHCCSLYLSFTFFLTYYTKSYFSTRYFIIISIIILTKQIIYVINESLCINSYFNYFVVYYFKLSRNCS